MRFFESIFILDPDISEEQVESTTKNMEKVIASNGGNVLNVENWGKHKLAYQVKKRRFGTYILFHVEGEPSVMGELERTFKFSEEVIKYQTIRIGKESVGKTKLFEEMEAERAPAEAAAQVEEVKAEAKAEAKAVEQPAAEEKKVEGAVAAEAEEKEPKEEPSQSPEEGEKEEKAEAKED